MRHIFIFLINIYQLTLGPHLGGRCRFEPSCSRYAVDAIRAYGSLKGSWLALKRIAKCGPWHSGGFDPVVPPLPPR